MAYRITAYRRDAASRSWMWHHQPAANQEGRGRVGGGKNRPHHVLLTYRTAGNKEDTGNTLRPIQAVNMRKQKWKSSEVAVRLYLLIYSNEGKQHRSDIAVPRYCERKSPMQCLPIRPTHQDPAASECLSDTGVLAATGDIRAMVAGRRVTSAFMSLSNSSSCLSTKRRQWADVVMFGAKGSYTLPCPPHAGIRETGTYHRPGKETNDCLSSNPSWNPVKSIPGHWAFPQKVNRCKFFEELQHLV